MRSDLRSSARSGFFRPRQDIVHRFIAYLTVLSVLPLVGLGLASFEISRSALEDQARHHLRQVLDERKRYIDLQTEQIEALIANISGVEAITNSLATHYNPADTYSRLLMQAQIGYILNSYVNINGLVSIDIFSDSGAQHHVGDTLDVGNLRREVLEELRGKAIATTRQVYWAGIVDNVNGNSKHTKVITAAKAIFGFVRGVPEPVPLGLLLVNYDVEYLKQQFRRTDSDDPMGVALVDASGRLVYHSDSRLTASTVDPTLMSRMRGDTGTFIHTINEQEMFVSYLRSEPSGWPIVGFVPLSAVDDHAEAIGQATALVVILCLLIAIAAAVAYSRRVVTPMRQITSRFKELRTFPAQAQTHLPVRGEDDITELTRSFNAFLDSLHKHERDKLALHASEARFRTIFEGAGLGMVVIRRDGQFELTNRTFLEMLDYRQEELLGKTVSDLIHADDLNRIYAELPPLSDDGVRSRRYEARFVRRDGESLSVRVNEALFPRTAPNGDHVIAAIEDITLQKQAEAERQARIAAEGANRAKSAFLATMSHEFRTPLNAILGYAQILRRDKGLGEWQMDGVRTIHESGEHLLALVNDVLDLSKIEAGKLSLQVHPVNPKGLLRNITDTIRVKADEKGILFVYEAAPDLPISISVDEKRLRQVLLNLLGNAVKFTDRGKIGLYVRILSRRDAHIRLQFEVEDTGVGIAENEFETIFEPFEQVGDVRRYASGTGLGLAISRRLVRMMGSDIHVESHIGRGSRFWFDIDAPLDETAAEPVPVQRTIIGYQGLRRKVLVADDVTANRAVVIDLLRSLGFETTEAVNGQEAIDKAQTFKPDLVLMDIMMPVMGGAEAIRLLREMPAFKKIPVLAASASTSSLDRQRSIAMGATDFLPKPLDLDFFLKQLGRHLRLTWVYEQYGEAPIPLL